MTDILPFTNSIFASQLLTFHRLRGQAIGIEHDNWFVRGLRLFAYQLAQQETQLLSDLTQAAFLKNVIEKCQVEVKQMIDGADTAEKRREILPMVQKYYEQAERAEIRLEALHNE